MKGIQFVGWQLLRTCVLAEPIQCSQKAQEASQELSGNVEEGMDRGGLDGNLKGLESIQRGGPKMRVEGERKESDPCVLAGDRSARGNVRKRMAILS